MGLVRKLASVSTLGLVDFRSPKERKARNARQAYLAQKQRDALAAERVAAELEMRHARRIVAEQAAADHHLVGN